jgi:uncharacterized membrane protein YsdA (DUF1294 family)/cold shock CspA family protein
MRFEGTLKTWDDDRGVGTILPSKGGDEIYVHISAMNGLRGRPTLKQRLSFEVELGPQGRKRAKNVEAAQAPRSSGRTSRTEPPASWTVGRLLAIPAFGALFVAMAAVWRVPQWAAAVYAGASALTYAVYTSDKRAARRGGSRVPEAMLHLMSLAGGWPGALLAQQFLRHKTTKPGFRKVFIATGWLNVAAFVALCAPQLRALWGTLGLG